MFVKHTLETRKYLSDVRKNKYNGEDNNFYGKIHSEETKKEIGIISRIRGKYLYTLINPLGEIFSDIIDLRTFCENNNLKINEIRETTYINKNKSYNGWFIKRRLKDAN